MADNSNFVLRWEIDNPTAVHAAGKAESGVFNEGGFKWVATAERDGSDLAKFTLRFGLNDSRAWKCKAKTSIHVLRNVRSELIVRSKKKLFFSKKNNFWCPPFLILWKFLTDQIFYINDKVIVEFHIHIIKSYREEPVTAKLAAPNSKNIVVKIGDKRLLVSKERLSIHSPVFEAMFFGNFAEKGKNEVEIKEIIYEEFIDLLNVVYVQTAGITDRTVPHILKLADRFGMKHIVELARNHLTQSTGFDTVHKLIMADQYRLTELRDHCLNSFKSIAELTGKLKPSPEIANASDQMKLAIFDRIWALKLQ